MVFYFIFAALWVYFKFTILGKRADEIALEITTVIMRIKMGNTNDESQSEKKQREKFINRERQGFGKLLYDSTRDCPICLMEFTEKDQVVALACNKQHVYHTTCIDQLLASPHVKNKCSLCQASIEFEDQSSPAME